MVFEKIKDGRVILGAVSATIFTIFLLSMNFAVSYATISSNTIAASANVLGTCYISLSPNTITFGGSGVTPGITTSANTIVDTDQNGNIAANILVYSSDWTGPSPSSSFAFSGTYTETNSILPSGAYSSVPNSISSIALTQLVIPAPTLTSPSASANVFFELNVPGGLGAGVYSQTITIENSC
ncbi:MAG: hypothetical protein QXD23_02230 [Candidatus Micrarchaeaceae archaeon]